MTELTGLSETDSANTSITGANVDEGSPMASLNDAIRNLSGAIARGYNRLTGKYASTGTAPNYVLTPTVALTFDDGFVNVARLLDLCRAAGVTLTLFPIGSQIEKHPELWQ